MLPVRFFHTRVERLFRTVRLERRLSERLFRTVRPGHRLSGRLVRKRRPFHRLPARLFRRLSRRLLRPLLHTACRFLLFRTVLQQSQQSLQRQEITQQTELKKQIVSTFSLSLKCSRFQVSSRYKRSTRTETIIVQKYTTMNKPVNIVPVYSSPYYTTQNSVFKILETIICQKSRTGDRKNRNGGNFHETRSVSTISFSFLFRKVCPIRFSSQIPPNGRFFS